MHCLSLLYIAFTTIAWPDTHWLAYNSYCIYTESNLLGLRRRNFLEQNIRSRMISPLFVPCMMYAKIQHWSSSSKDGKLWCCWKTLQCSIFFTSYYAFSENCGKQFDGAWHFETYATFALHSQHVQFEHASHSIPAMHACTQTHTLAHSLTSDCLCFL